MPQADTKNPRLAHIPEPDPGNNAVDSTAQNIKNRVQQLRGALMIQLAPQPPAGDAGWKTSVRIIRHTGRNVTPATVQHLGGYTPINSLKEKTPNIPVNQDAQFIKRALVSFSKSMIQQEKELGNLTGDWRAIVRIIPKLANGSPDPSVGCGCGCS